MAVSNYSLSLEVNHEEHIVLVRPVETLLDVLRTELGLTGAKPGCLNGDCGSCTVLIDGEPMKSCLMLAVEAPGHDITTIEGLNNVPIQQAFINKWGFQCGYCTPGFIMNAHALVTSHPNASEVDIQNWLESNICRCTSYQEIKEAVYDVLHKEEDLHD